MFTYSDYAPAEFPFVQHFVQFAVAVARRGRGRGARGGWGSAPDPCWGLPPPDPLLNWVWGRAPMGFVAEPQRGSGGGAILAAKPPVFWGGAPND